MLAKFYKLPVEIAQRQDLTGIDKVIFAVILNRIGKNKIAWPGERRIAEDSGAVRSTVQASIRRLEKLGILQVDRRGQGRVCHYQIFETGPKIGPVDESKSKPTGPKIGHNWTENKSTTGPKIGHKKNRTIKDQGCVTPQQKNKSLVRSKQRFVKPTTDEIREYAESNGYDDLDVAKFYDYYEAGGWVVGRNKPMKDWRAAVRNWQRNEKKWRSEKPVDPDLAFFMGEPV